MEFSTEFKQALSADQEATNLWAKYKKTGEAFYIEQTMLAMNRARGKYEESGHLASAGDCGRAIVKYLLAKEAVTGADCTPEILLALQQAKRHYIAAGFPGDTQKTQEILDEIEARHKP